VKNHTTFYVGSALILLMISLACNSPKSIVNKGDEQFLNQKYSDTVTMTSDDGEYQIIIIEPGFYGWLNSYARVRGYYSQNFFVTRNLMLVQEYNLRVQQPLRFDPNLYPFRIEYYPGIDYGYELNYQLYNYFVYFQLHYKQRLTPIEPRI
jgi:hypothetical protein